MPNPLAEACYELALANRIIAHEGVLDGLAMSACAILPIPAAICSPARAAPS